MRIGTNPEKLQPRKLIHKPHRVIIPVYIPNLEEEYFRNALDVLKLCLDSLRETTDPSQTNITVINNASCKEVDNYLEKCLHEGKIEKYVKRLENRGKVEPVLSEAMGSLEEYITISDADVFFRRGWFEETFEIFNNFPKAGVVSPIPIPNNYTQFNDSCLVDNFLFRRLYFDSIVSSSDMDEFEKSIGGVRVFNKVRCKQYFLKSNGVNACVGAAHFVATYRQALFNCRKREKPSVVFENGLEKKFIDNLTERYGLCRLSTVKSFVYHMGNNPIVEKEREIDSKTYNKKIVVKKPRDIRPLSLTRIFLDRFLGKVLRKHLNRKMADCKSGSK